MGMCSSAVLLGSGLGRGWVNHHWSVIKCEIITEDNFKKPQSCWIPALYPSLYLVVQVKANLGHSSSSGVLQISTATQKISKAKYGRQFTYNKHTIYIN